MEELGNLEEIVPEGGTGVKGVKHTFDALAGMSDYDRQMLMQMKQDGTRDKLKQGLNRLIRERQGLPVAEPYQQPQYNPPQPVIQQPAVVKYLCGLCQEEMLPGVQHVCKSKENPFRLV